MSSSPEPRFWRSLLLQRREVAWGTFTWFSASVLLQSANDQVAKHIDSTIVNRRRMRFVERQQAHGVDVHAPVRLDGMKRMVILGDPGEMDASQYVLLRELYAAEADTLLLMSDIVYPAGSVNAWRDAVYLPYLGLPAAQFDEAVRSWRNKAGDVADEHLPGVPDWRVFATPGNHDWYDGLNGFMFNACGVEPLADVRYSRHGLTSQQAISRALWQRPERPNRTCLEPLRAAAKERRPDTPRAMPCQPGPYFSIDVHVAEETPPGPRPPSTRMLRLACVDTGIDGSIDVGQAMWLDKQLREDPQVPKIVITGKPLAVEQKLNRFPIYGAEYMDPTQALPALTRNGAKLERELDLRDLLGRGERVIATVAGDIHNYQRLVLLEPGDPKESAGSPPEEALAAGHVVMYVGLHDPQSVVTPKTSRLPPLQIVSGGGGAFLSETHKVEFEDSGCLHLSDELNESAITVEKGHHERYPSREESVRLFGLNVHPRTAGVAIAIAGLGSAATAFLLIYLMRDPSAISPFGGTFEMSTAQLVLGAFGTLAVLGIGGFLVAVRGSTAKAMLSSPPFVATTVLAVILFVAGWWTELQGAPLLLAGTALAGVIPLLLVAVPLLRSYPSLRKLLPIRPLLAAAGAYVVIIEDVPVIALFGVLAAAVGAFLGIRALARELQDRAREGALEGRRYALRAFLVVVSLWPALAVAALLYPLDDLLKGKQSEEFVDAIRIIAVIDLLIALTAAAALISLGLLRARRTAPLWYLMLIGAGFAGGCALGLLVAEPFPSEWYAAVGDGVSCLFAGVGGALAVASLMIGFQRQLPREFTHDIPGVAEALVARDGHATLSKKQKSLRLFRAMAVSHLPGIAQMAESTEPPFYKSYTTMEAAWEGTGLSITLTTFGVEDEREPQASGTQRCAERTPRGSYPVDRVRIVVPDVHDVCPTRDETADNGSVGTLPRQPRPQPV